MKGILVCPFYNEIDALPKLLDTTSDFDMRIFADGKWKEFPDPNANKEGLSYDGSRELIENTENTVLLDCGNTSEEFMINRLFNEASKHNPDYVFLMGSDEYIKWDKKEFESNLKMEYDNIIVFHQYRINNITVKVTPPSQVFETQPRIFRYPHITYAKWVHWWFFVRDHRTRVGKVIEGLTLYHDDSPRTTKREEQMLEYQKKNVIREERIAAKKWFLLQMESLLDEFYDTAITSYTKKRVWK